MRIQLLLELEQGDGTDVVSLREEVLEVWGLIVSPSHLRRFEALSPPQNSGICTQNDLDVRRG